MDVRVFTVVALVAGSPAAGVASASSAASDAAPSRSDVVPYRVTDLTAETFARPPREDRPWVRWNLPDGTDPAELQAELEEMARSGIAGAEIGQRGFPTADQLAAILTRANELGISISLSHGPVNSPPGFSVDDDTARKTLVVGHATVEAGETFDGATPSPAPPEDADAGKRTTLVAVSAYRCSSPACPDSGLVDLVRSSFVDLTPSVTGTNTEGVWGGSTAGHLTWTAPDDPAGAQWRIVAFWTRGLEAEPDLLSLEGTRALTAGMEAAFSEVAPLMRANHGDFFYDSHSRDRGSPTDSWTIDMRRRFREARGYDLVPHLPALFPEDFSFDDGSADRVRNDFYQTRTDIWLENHVKPLQEWAHRTYGWQIRLQPYGENAPTVDEIQAASVIDRPETENLWFGSAFDHYLPMASASHMTANPWLSTECCAVSNLSYGQTWQDTLIRMHKSFVGGITKLVFHVYPYAYTDTSLWPGFHLFGQGFSNAWGPRNPYWADAATYNDSIARHQQVLTQGRARVDLAVYMQSYLYPWVNGTEDHLYWVDPALDRAGYTRDYLNPSLLLLPDAEVKDRRLAPNGPAYKAFVIDSSQWPETDPVRTSMPVDVAKRVLSFARAGLPVVLVGTPPDRTPGNTPDADAEVRAVIAELLAQESVHRAARQADVPRLLHSLGVRPSAEPSEDSTLLSVRRSVPDADYYFLYNEVTPKKVGARAGLGGPVEGEPLDVEVGLEGRGQPYLLNAWTGEITPIARCRVEEDRVTVRVQLAPEQATVIALTTNGGRFGLPGNGLHVTSFDHDVVYGSDGTIVLRATSNGTHSVTLSDGRTVTVTAQGVADPIDLSGAGWRLSVEDWQPAHPYATTTGARATETRKTTHEHELRSLEAWPNIPELADVSGIGVYTTTVRLPADWTPPSGADLSLGEVFDSFVVSINGRPVLFNPLSTTADVGRYLRPGENTISVRVATTLRNRLRTLEEAQEARPRQPYGLVGPVVLQPYREIEIR